ncbi:MAG: T9SS type A sorting domain-containing protein [Bacteroidales bacterium]|nr:T9SS type A sorting domain-containing protein [Bacteroidales bacterium]
MKNHYLLGVLIISSFIMCFGQSGKKNILADIDYVSAFKDTLDQLANRTDETLFKLHFNSISELINAKIILTKSDSFFIQVMHEAFNDDSDTSSAKVFSSYLKRQRPIIHSWISPTDGEVSFTKLKLPKNWDPEKEYPLYIELHGLWDVASNTMEYMSYSFTNSPSKTFAFEDGYFIAPWGRGNLWYQGISETDIWECIDEVEKIVNIDPSRKYLTGHSMGGYGAWYIGSHSPGIWAALGIHAGALWYNNSSLVTDEVAGTFNNLPVYFVCGDQDGLLGINQQAYQLLSEAGNSDIEFVTFSGGHDYFSENVENMYLWMKSYINDNLTPNEIADNYTDGSAIKINNYPNPVQAITTIYYSINTETYVNLYITDMFGKIISTLESNNRMPGNYKFLFNASGLTNGIYIIWLNTGNSNIQRKIVVVK